MIDTLAKIEVRRFATLGGASHGWLDAHHHFSFAAYHDPARMGWGKLRVWNDDIIAPQTGFPSHPHADMEIITFVRSGAITHKDSLGNTGRTVAGDVQVMSAGTGIRHSEYNQEDTETAIFQIWIEPNERSGAPSWGTKHFPREGDAGSLQLLASGFAGDADALPIRSDARVFGANLNAGQQVELSVEAGRHTYLVPASGRVEVNHVPVNARDGVAISEGHVIVTAVEDSALVIVDTA